MIDMDDNDRVNEISRALQSMLTPANNGRSKATQKTKTKVGPRKSTTKRSPSPKTGTSKARAKKNDPKPIPAKQSAPAKTSRKSPALKQPTKTSKQADVKTTPPPPSQVISQPDFSQLAKKLRLALDDVRMRQVISRGASSVADEDFSHDSDEIIAHLRDRLEAMSDEIDASRARVAEELLQLDTTHRRITEEIHGLLRTLSDRLVSDT